MVFGLSLLLAVSLYAAWTLHRLNAAVRLAPAPPVNHGPLPEAVRNQVLETVSAHLENATLIEIPIGKLREFQISGKPKDRLAQDFYAAFRPLVVTRLMPLLRPYGEIISFEIKDLDLPPARLREIPAEPQQEISNDAKK